jgi:Fe-S-cluster-containing dehydrogenase component/formate-dependent nitrite reductase membrane component NrfD
MKYGFIIDNRKCIGCHACTVACKSEHDVPIGVNRTWVKQVEKGQYPDTQRVFSVMRCNHCTNAPCVEICPVEALHVREDGIVDFDNSRCIGCKACTQACPYDALYIDPETNTAAKCNYCSHRVEVGLEPACVNVCPEHAIISGDMEDPESEISQLLSTQKVTVRKPEKGTEPNLFYINGDDVSLTPTYSNESDSFLWNSQDSGVGHFAKYADAKKNQADTEAMKQTLAGNTSGNGQKQIEAIMSKSRRVYDAPSKGVLWGWEVSAYVWTKAVSTGAFLVPFLALGFGLAEVSETIKWAGMILALVFLSVTGGLLIKDLDKPTRFLYILLRPQWKSWLVRGGYAITLFGGLLTLWGLSIWMGWQMVENIALWAGAILGVITSIYTAFLFAQAKSRDFWQSPALSLHMLLHSFMAGAAVFGIISMITGASEEWSSFLNMVLLVSVGFNLFTMLLELATPHATIDAKNTVKMILSGRYKNLFWMGVVIVGNVLPLILVGFDISLGLPIASILILIGIYITEHIWVQAPQQIPLS